MCLKAGLTYVCDSDIEYILEQKCININYLGLDGESELEQNVCGRALIDFLNGGILYTED